MLPSHGSGRLTSSGNGLGLSSLSLASSAQASEARLSATQAPSNLYISDSFRSLDTCHPPTTTGGRHGTDTEHRHQGQAIMARQQVAGVLARHLHKKLVQRRLSQAIQPNAEHSGKTRA